MDVQMPVLSGLDAVAQIRAIEFAEPHRGHTPVVALTAHAMAGDRERCLAAGMDSYVSKPVSPALLAQAIHEARVSRRAPEDGWEVGRIDEAADLFAPEAELPPAVDMRQLVRTLGGDLAVVREIAVAMRSDMAVRRDAIAMALQERDAAAGQEQVHALKGALASIGAHEAARLAKSVEAAWRQGDWDGVVAAAGQLEREVERVDAALEQVVDG